MEEKRFDRWMEVKAGLHGIVKFPKFSTGEIWWCGVGENVGVEINSKSELFSRPVLILKKLSRCGFLGVPLTSQEHIGSWYVSFLFHGKNEFAVLSQQRTMSVLRLYTRMGKIDEEDLRRVKEGFMKLYS